MKNKTVHFYWGGDSLSFMRYMTLHSFKLYHPDWKINLWVPYIQGQKPTWNTLENKRPFKCKNYFKYAEKIAKILPVDFNIIEFDNQFAEVHKSDYLRWYLMGYSGGLWLDIDILFIKKLPYLTTDAITFDPFLQIYYVAFLYSDHAKYWQPLFENCLKHFDSKKYQCIGSSLVSKYIDSRIFKIDPIIILPFQRVSDIPSIYTFKSKMNSSTSGIHWFGGHRLSRNWENTLTHENVYNYQNTFCQEIVKCLKLLPITPLIQDTKKK